MTLGQVYELLAGARTEIARLVTSGDPVLIEDLSKDLLAAAHRGQGLDIERLYSFAAVPLRSKEKVMSMLTPMSRDCHQFTPQDVGLLTSSAAKSG